VFRLPRRLDLRHSPEVAATAWVDLDRLLGPGVYGDWDVGLGVSRCSSPAIMPEGIVWA
jgi:hypothetical protein